MWIFSNFKSKSFCILVWAGSLPLEKREMIKPVSKTDSLAQDSGGLLFIKLWWEMPLYGVTL